MQLKIFFKNGLKSVVIEADLKKLLDHLNSNQFVTIRKRIYNTSLVTMVCEYRESKKERDEARGKPWQPPK
jgi:hypothetical protein